MKHHSQRSKRPPSRTLAPRILAALTAGAVTLGALPCAYAANKFIVTSSVTEDTEVEYGVVGNIDGAPATITVGRVGYGGTPVIYTKDGYGNAVEWRNAFGTFGESNTVNATFDVRGGRAILRSGSLMGFFGAFGGVLNGGTAHVEGNSAGVSGGTVSWDGAASFIVARGIYGGYAHAQILHGTQTRAEAVRNTVTMTGGAIDSDVTGGSAKSDNDIAGNTTTSEALAEENTVTITGGKSVGPSYIEGGYADARSHLGNGISIAKALKNRVRMNTNMRTEKITGGYTFTETRGGIRLYSNENQVHLRTNANDVAGGRADGKQFDRTGIPAALSTVEANANKVWVTERSCNVVRGGYARLTAGKTKELRAAANENELSIAGGNFDNIWGGDSFIESERTDADTFAAATANKNKLWVDTHAGWFNADLIGGSAKVQATAGRAEAAAHENELYVKGDQQNIYSGSAEAASENGSAAAQATKNYLSTETSVTPGITGGHAVAKAKGTFDVLASENLLSLAGGARSFIGGYAEGTQQDSGTYVLQSTGTANENSMEIRSTGTFTDKSAGGYVHITANNTKLLSAAAARNEVLLQDGTFNEDVAGGRSFARNTTTAADSVTNAAANENTVHALGGTYGAGLYGGSAYAEAKREFNASANKNKLAVSAGAKNFIGGYAEGKQLAPGESVTHSTAKANENKVWVGAGAGTFTDKSAAGYSTIETNNVAEPKAEANSNQLTIRAGTFLEDVTSGRSFARNTSANGSAGATAVDNRLWVYGSTTRFQRDLIGGSAEARAAGNYSANVEASGNITHLMKGTTYDGDVYGGMAQGGSETGNVYLTSRNNELYIHGGTYRGNIYAGAALGDLAADPNDVHEEVHHNKIVISGANDLSFASLYGYRHRVGGGNAYAADNELILKNTKNITVKSVQGFDRFAFYVPSDITEDDTMLYVRDDTRNIDLSGKTVDAYLQGSTTLPNRIRLLHTVNAEILNDAAATMTVHEGISGTERISVTTNRKELIVRRDGLTDAGGPVPEPSAPTPDTTPLPSGATPPTPPGSPPVVTPPSGIVTPPPTPPALPPETPYDGGFRLIGDHAKSLAETMAGSVAFIGSGMNLFTGLGMSSASIEAAAAEGFAPFAAMSGSSMRIATGSHVDLKGMNLAVGFSREVKRDDNRLIFGPIVEYGRGTYDSYVNAAHGDGSIRYIGAGGFIRQEQKDGMFYEGSLRAGRSNMDYSATLNVGGTPRHTSYDTRANYIGAHLGAGQSTTMKDGGKQEVYVRYFYTRQNGTDATLSTGDRYSFSAVDSHILRTGARWMHPQKGGSLIVGASVQYEFGGDASATYHRAGGMSYTSPSPSLKGVSASVELGWKTRMSANSTADLSVEGWTGKQRGVNFRAGFAWQF